MQEELSLGAASVSYKAFKDVWVVTFDGPLHSPMYYTWAIPQICLPEALECRLGQISFAHVSCEKIRELLLDPVWFNENAATDIEGAGACPSSFVDEQNSQVLVGSVMPESFVYVTVPMSLVIHNNATMLSRFDRSGSDADWGLVVRLLFLTRVDVGTHMLFSVRRYVAHLTLARPDISTATLSVQSSCSALGLRAPVDAQLQMRAGADGKPVCVWVCRVDSMRTPWNMPPGAETSGQCRPLSKYFTAVEFAFTIDTQMHGTAPSRLSEGFYAELDTMGQRIEAVLQGHVPSLVALSVPYSDFDTVSWREWMHDFISFSHRNDALLNTNSTLLIDALREMGHYTETHNEAFTYSWRRFYVEDITVKGIWITSDVERRVDSLTKLLIKTVAETPHPFSAELQVQRIALVDIAHVHRLAPLLVGRMAVEARMQRDGVTALMMLCLMAVLMAYSFYRCREGPGTR